MQDKLLRKTLQLHIITDIKNINARSKNMQLNSQLQDFFSKKLTDNHAVAVKTALDVMIELYKKNIWRNKRNVNIIATACYAKVAKIMVTALKFFVGNDEGEQEESSSESEAEAPNVTKALLAMRVNKKTKKKRQGNIEKVKKAANEQKKKKNKKLTYDFSALHLINDPQTVAEKIFKIFNKRNERFEVKLLMMNMVSRLIGIHQLYLGNFYPTLQRFMRPHQREVTKVMQYAAQAAHPLMPPDELQPMLSCLTNNFVTERYAPEVMAMGLNAIRELCNRNIHAMDEDLLQDLIGYRNHKDKGVFMAARSLMTLFRTKNPSLLARKNRGVPTELIKEVGVSKFGENSAKDFIPGAEILAFNTNSKDFQVAEDDESDSDSTEDEVEEMAVNEDNETEAEVSQDCDNENDEDQSMVDEEERSSEEDESSVNDYTLTTVDNEESEYEEYDDDCDSTDEDDTSVAAQQEAISRVILPQNEKNIEPNRSLKKKEAIKKVMELSLEERAAIAGDIVSSRFLTDEDFARIDAVQAAKQVQRFHTKNKRKYSEMENDDREIVPLSKIEMIHSKRARDKASRIAAVMEGREGREKFGSRKGRSNPNASTTNREKKKAKSFNMVKHKMRSNKQKTTFKDKKDKLKISMLRKLKNS